MIQSLINLFKPSTPDWKKPIEVEFKDNMLSIQTKDLNWKQYILLPGTHDVWRNRSSKVKTITDKALNDSLNNYYSLALTGKYIKGRGWVKSL